MKKLFYFSVAFLCFSGYSQDIMDTLGQETCACIKQKNPDLKAANINIESSFMACFFESYSRHAEEVNKVEKLEMDNDEQMGAFGEKVAMKMLGYCPEYLIALGEKANLEEKAADVKYTTVEGQISEIKTEQFVSIILKDKNSRTHNLLLMDYFDTASLYTDSKIKKNDQISVTYSEIEMYDPKLKEFRYYKVIASLEKK